MNTNGSQQTPLYEAHKKLGGKIVSFAGWELPVRYSELIEEHQAVRNAAGLFDVSHMGEISVTGKDALQYIQYITCNDVSKLIPGKAQYSAFLNEQGGVIDDIIVYCYSAENYFICVNASNADKDFAWCQKNIGKFNVTIQNKSKDFAQIAIQGPQAINCLQATLKESLANNFDLNSIKTFHFAEQDTNYGPLILARTGYTGEDGFEIFINPKQAENFWFALLEAGKAFGLKPCGLGARDSLRLEACYPLHGHELGENISALASGLGWIVKFDKPDFIGKSALHKEHTSGSQKKLIGFFVEGAGIVREQTNLYDSNNKLIGVVTSGTLTPTVKKALGMALIESQYASIDTQVFADVRGRKLPCRVVKIPFYKKAK